MPVNTRIQIRRGTASEWVTANPQLYAGEIGYETDTGKIKIGDGTTNWTTLDYASTPINSGNFIKGDGLTLDYGNLDSNVTFSIDESWLANFIASSSGSLNVEGVQDIIGNSGVAGGFGINKSYNDGTGFTTVSVTGMALRVEESTGIGVSVASESNNNVYTISVTGIDHTLINDWDAALSGNIDTQLIAGTGIQFAYDSGNNTLTISTAVLDDTHTHIWDNITDAKTKASLTELGYLSGVAPGTASASRAIVLDSSKDISGIRNITATDTVTAATFSGTLVASSVDINGGSIDGTVIGANSAAVVSGTSVFASTGFFGDLTGNADTASQVKTQSTATNADFYLTFVDSNNGSATAETVYTDAQIKYNPSTDTLTVSNITGNIASASTVATIGTNTGTHYLTFVDSNNGTAANETVRTDGNLSYNAATNTLSAGNVSATGTVSANHVGAATLTTTGNVQIGGDLTVAGTTTTVNSTVVEIGDNIIRVNTSGLATGGIEVQAGSTSNYKQFVWDNSDSRWELGSEDLQADQFISTVADGTAPLVVTSTTVVANLNSDYLDGQHGSYYLDWGHQTNLPDPVITVGLNGDVVGTGTYTWTDLSGNPTITLSTVIQPNSVALGTDTTGQYASTVSVAGTGLSATAPNAGDGTAYTITSNATPANTANTIVSRDASGNFSAGTITGTLSGTATNANNINISATTSTDTTTSVVLVANQTTGNQSPFIDSNLTYDAQNNNLSATTFTGALAGNASTASKLQTARTIELIGDVTGSANFDGSANIQITTAVSGAGTVTLANEGTDTDNYITFANNATGDEALKTNTSLRFDASGLKLLGSAVGSATTPATRLEYFIVDGGTP